MTHINDIIARARDTLSPRQSYADDVLCGRQAAGRQNPHHKMTPAAIRSAREQAGLTQTAAADLIGVSRVTWTRWETGASPPPSEHVWRYFLHVAGIERIPFRSQQ